LFLELLFLLFQLDELGFAEGSPVRRSVEEQHSPCRPPQRVKGLLSAALIKRLEKGNVAAHLKAGLEILIQLGEGSHSRTVLAGPTHTRAPPEGKNHGNRWPSHQPATLRPFDSNRFSSPQSFKSHVHFTPLFQRRRVEHILSN